MGSFQVKLNEDEIMISLPFCVVATRTTFVLLICIIGIFNLLSTCEVLFLKVIIINGLVLFYIVSGEEEYHGGHE